MGNLTSDRAPRNPTTPTTIHVSRFQPFESRVGIDYVLRLDFDYDPELIAHLKRFLAEYKADAVNRDLGRLTPGGWLSHHRCWFIEPCIWEAVMLELEFSGYRIQEVSL